MSRSSYWWTALCVLAADQATKAHVVTRFTDETAIPIVPGLLRLVRVENSGIAFGMFSQVSSPVVGPVLALISAGAIVMVGYLLWQNQPSAKLAGAALALILGGAAGNLMDRLARGRVVDFLDFYVGNYHWPAFNLADSAICVGAGILLLELILEHRQKLPCASSENR